LRSGVHAKIGPFVQILNIIEGHIFLSSSFYKDFNEERIVVARMQILMNIPEHLKGKRPRR
jgi:hypothetical protein